MIVDEDNYLAHYGILRRSGRYPWGSGKDPYQRSIGFFATIEPLRKQGLSDTEIARGFGMTTTEFRNVASIAKNEKRAGDQSHVQRLHDKGMSNMAISRQTGFPESTVRALLKPGVTDRLGVLQNTTQVLKDAVDKKKYIDVGTGVEYHLAISRQKLDSAIAVLKDQGYSVHPVKIEQLGTGKMTEMKVLVPPGVTQKEAWMNRNNIQQVQSVSYDGGRSFFGIEPPLHFDSKRLGINYAEDGGSHADGVIYVRRGVPDVDLGGKNYAQVRIAVDGTHFIKGMAIYKDDLPPGMDLVFNTNKSNTGNKLDALKPLKEDPDNPFGAVIDRQILRVHDNGKTEVTSVMNLVNEEGTWDTWSKTLSSQFLSKQEPILAKRQLDMTYEQRKNELDSILQLTNPAVRRTLLEKFADGADSAAVHLKAAHMPRQSTHVILPVPSMKETEVYAPNFNHGERVVLVRHPHGGIFEIPELVVNNKQPDAKKLLGSQAKDAIGISHEVAKKLSGADFDGDTVLVIPNGSGSIRTKPSLRGLQNFDPQRTYPGYDGMKVMTSSQTQTEMGKISNLITDMTLKGANDEELARAVRHSMVVIDAEKHKLNYKQSAIDNGISQLKTKYQGGANKGAATLISRKKHEIEVPARIPRRAGNGGPIDPATGQKMYEPTGEKTRGGALKTEKVKKILEVADVREMSSGTKMENLYADHSNRLKDLANKARLESTRVQSVRWSPSAKEHYSKEVASLTTALQLAKRNAPLERQAQVLANAQLSIRRRANPDMTPPEIKKIKGQLLEEMRTRTGASKTKIRITQEEWNAIQAGAISNHQLTEILKHADLDKIKEYATPQRARLMTASKKARAQEMLSQGYSQQDVASSLGVSLTTLKTNLEGG